MKRTATYWPPGSWERESSTSGGKNVAVQMPTIWTKTSEGDIEVYLESDVAEGGYLFDGISQASNPLLLHGARKIALFLQHPDLRSLRQVRKAILE